MARWQNNYQEKRKTSLNMEVEIKVKLKNLNSIKNKLLKLGAKIGKSKKQLDIFYKPKNKAWSTLEPGSYILRVRESNGDKFLTFKALTSIKGAWEEYEVKIDNIRAMQKIIERLGLIKVFSLEKVRIPGRLGKFEFNLDKVKEIGSYMEIGLIDKDGIRAQNKIRELFSKLGVSENQLERRGYGEIVSAKMGIKSKGIK
jgi:adenylate cyclase class 2